MNKMHDREIDLASEQVLVSRRCICGMHPKAETRVSEDQTGDHAADKAFRDRDGCPDGQISSGRIRNEPDILDALLDLIEDRSSPLHKCLAVGCRLDSVGIPIKKPDAK